MDATVTTLAPAAQQVIDAWRAEPPGRPAQTTKAAQTNASADAAQRALEREPQP